MYDFNAERATRHAEHEKEFGEKPFTFGHIEDEEGNLVPAKFFVRANVGYLGVKRVAALSDATEAGETFGAIENAVFSMIDPEDGPNGEPGGALARFKEVTASLRDPITFEDLVKLQNWLLVEQTNLPPTEPEPSSASSTQTGTPSTESSSERPVAASTP
jgi:hypothetical protein